jgi:hypothetical protein
MNDVMTKQCPSCGQNLLPGANRCQFCGHDFVGDVPVKSHLINVHPDTKAMIWYNVCAVFWIVIALLAAVKAMFGSGYAVGQAQVSQNPTDSIVDATASARTVLTFGIGFVVAAGMLARQGWARRAGVIYSWFGTVLLSIGSFYEAYEVLIEDNHALIPAFLFSVVMVVLTFVTRWSITNTEGI